MEIGVAALESQVESGQGLVDASLPGHGPNLRPYLRLNWQGSCANPGLVGRTDFKTNRDNLGSDLTVVIRMVDHPPLLPFWL